jgi:segregation and condensation protein B
MIDEALDPNLLPDEDLPVAPPPADALPLPPIRAEDYARFLEALIFASAEPIEERVLRDRLGDDAPLETLLGELASTYEDRGVRLVQVGTAWAFRTAPDLGPYMVTERTVIKKPPRTAVETLAIIAYHQPVTRAEIETIRGVATSRGTLDLLMENGWIKPGPRRETPGRPVTWLTTQAFLDHFGLTSLRDLPNAEELKASGLLDPRPVLAGLPREGKEETPASADDAPIEEEL